jgi:hypothetical protein
MEYIWVSCKFMFYPYCVVHLTFRHGASGPQNSSTGLLITNREKRRAVCQHFSSFIVYPANAYLISGLLSKVPKTDVLYVGLSFQSIQTS